MCYGDFEHGCLASRFYVQFGCLVFLLYKGCMRVELGLSEEIERVKNVERRN